MHRLHCSFVLGFHGCDRTVAETVISGREPLRPSKNDYDWLGPGVYFWEANPRRGLEFAFEAAERASRRKHRPVPLENASPSVVGAVIELGYCLDLTTSVGIEIVKEAHADMVATLTALGEKIPTNSEDRLRHNLDCAVMKYVRGILRRKKRRSTLYAPSSSKVSNFMKARAFMTKPTSRSASSIH